MPPWLADYRVSSAVLKRWAKELALSLVTLFNLFLERSYFPK